jgi:photosystem II stability/assembly factor-like uncharacterized protein
VWANPLPQGGDLDAIAFSGARGIAAGAGGLILRTEDAGVSFVSDTVGYILASGGALERTDDSGASWSVVAGQPAGARGLLATGVRAA